MRILCPLHGLATLILLSCLLTPSNTIPVSSTYALTSTTQNPALQKRLPPFSIHNLYLERTDHLSMLLPTTTAASLLADFYAEIYVRCITQCIPNLPPPQADLMIQYGAFQLSFVANDGSSEGIPWEFIRDFSATMLRVTRRGYTGVYDQGWWNVAGTLGVYVGLRVLQVGAEVSDSS